MSSKHLDRDKYIYPDQTSSKDVASSRRLVQDNYICIGHTSSRHLQDVFMMSSRRFQDVFKTSSRCLQYISLCWHVFNMFSICTAKMHIYRKIYHSHSPWEICDHGTNFLRVNSFDIKRPSELLFRTRYVMTGFTNQYTLGKVGYQETYSVSINKESVNKSISDMYLTGFTFL